MIPKVGVALFEAVEEVVEAAEIMEVAEDVDSARLMLLEDNDVSSYISSLLPAPQYSYGLPGHVNEQSVKGASTEPALITLPQ